MQKSRSAEKLRMKEEDRELKKRLLRVKLLRKYLLK